MKKIILLALCLSLLNITNTFGQDPIVFEAESGTLGADWTTLTDAGGVTYLEITTAGTNGNAPADAARVATYSVTFPATTTATLYKLYLRMWVSALPTPGNNDSVFIANGFGSSINLNSSGSWTTRNNLGNVGHAIDTDVVSTGNASPVVGSDTWKWSQITTTEYSVPAAGGTFFIQIGGREDGFFIDKLAFGDATVSYTVDNLDGNSSTLSINNVALENVSIYKSDANTLKIVGLQNGKTSVKIFNLLGKEILNTSSNANGIKEISLPKLVTGVYVIQLQTDKGKLSKKIIL